MNDKDAREVELKLEAAAADLDTLAKALADAGFKLKTSVQRSVYFDTPDLTLLDAGVSLRIRAVRRKRVQTMKADGGALAGLFVRREWNMPVANDTPVIAHPATPLRALLPHVPPDTLAPVFVVEVTRRVGSAIYGDAQIEAAVDVGRIVAADRNEAFGEIELELVEGRPDAMFALARRLGEAAPVRLGMLAKSERGYRLLDGAADTVVKAGRGGIRGPRTVAQAFELVVAACLRQFRLNEELLTRTGRADALHQARVALRRLRSALSIFKPTVADNRFEHLRAELRWLAATLGEARDIDVLIAGGDTGPLLDDARTAAYAAVDEALASPRARALMLDMAEWSAVGAWRSAPTASEVPDGSARRFAADTLERMRRRLKRRGRKLAKLDDEARHAVRIEAKKLRYAAEFFADLFRGGKARRRAKKFVNTMQALQERLGELNDLASAAVVRARLGLPDGTMPVAPPSAALIGQAADGFDELMDRKRFWR